MVRTSLCYHSTLISDRGWRRKETKLGKTNCASCSRRCAYEMLRMTSPMEVGILNGRVLYTGGAEGVDALAEELARRYDMSVCVIILPTHSRAVRITPLTESMLHEGLQHVLCTNKTLQCSLPNNVLKTGLLQRNYWVVRDTNLMLASHKPVVPIQLPATEICPMSPALPTPPKHYHCGKQTHHSSYDTGITQFISENHSDGN